MASRFSHAILAGQTDMVAGSATPAGASNLPRGTWTPNPGGTVRPTFGISRARGATRQVVLDRLNRRNTPTST